jgi:hypothetical protein
MVIFVFIFKYFLLILEYYEHILVKPSKSDKHFSLLGRTLRVKITGVSKFYMRSEIIGSNIFSISSNLTWTLITIVAAFVLYVFLLNFTFDS